MKREHLEKLLGGYAAGTLTGEEREALLSAALEDQELFDRLAAEEPLREALADPAARARLLAALDEPAKPWHARFSEWLSRPAGLAAGAAAAAVVVAAGIWLEYRPVRRPAAVETAQVRAPEQPMTVPAPAIPREEPKPAAPGARDKAMQAPAKNGGGPGPALPAPQAATGVVGGVPSGIPGGVPGGASGGSRGVAGGIAGGTPGGVIGGVIGAVPANAPPPPPPPPPAAKEYSSEAVTITPPKEPAREGAEAERKDAANSAFAPSPRLARGPARLTAKAEVAKSARTTLRVQVLVRAPDGTFSPAEAGAAFTTGARIRLVFETAEAGYLYVIQRAASGGWAMVASEQAHAGIPLQVPRDGALAYDQPGEKRIFAMLTAEPDADLARLDATAIERRLAEATAVRLTVR